MLAQRNLMVSLSKSASRGRREQPANVALEDAVRSFLSWLESERRNKPATITRCGSSLQSATRAIGPRRSLASLCPADIEDFKAARRQEGISEPSLRNDCHALSKLFKWGVRRHLCESNPLSQVDIPSESGSQRMYVVSPEEEARYFAAVQDRDLLHLAKLILSTGARPSEVLSLEAQDVDLANQSIFIRQGKTASARRKLPLSPECREIIRQRLQDVTQPAGRVFPCPGSQQAYLVKLDAAHRAVVKELGMEFVLYSLRHSFASRLAARGCPLATLAAILGHSSLRVVMRYVHPQQQEINRWMSA